MVSKIEQIIEEIEDLIDGCKYATFSSTKILVDKEEIDELLHELKKHTPDEISRCQKIISNKEAILADAHAKADELVAKAQSYSDEMVSEHQILQQAYAQAEEIVRQAKYQAQDIMGNASVQAENIQSSAIEYTDSSLASIQQILVASIQETQDNNNNLINSLSQILNVVNANRAELHPEEDELARNAAIAERAEAERIMAGTAEMQQMEAPVREAVQAPVQEMIPTPAPEPAPAPRPVNPVPEAPAQAPVSDSAPAPAPAKRNNFKGGVSKAILEAKE